MVWLAIIFVFTLMALGAPLFDVLLLAGVLGAIYTAGGDGRSFSGDFGGQISDAITLFTGEQSSILSTVPLFIFAGFLMAESGTAQRLVRVTRAGLGWLPGSLGVVTVVACALFTTFTGASGVTIVALGGLLMPSLLKENYGERFSLGLVTGTGSCGLLFPPAVPIIVYGIIYAVNAQTAAASQSSGSSLELIEFTTDRFLVAGIVPGLVLITILCLYVMVTAHRRKVVRHPFNAAELGRGVVNALPELILPFAIIAGLARGIDLPEIAALTVVYVLLIETALYRDLSLRSLGRLTRESMSLVGAIFIIIFGAQAFTNFLVTAKVPEALFVWIDGVVESPWMFLLVLNLLLLVVGMMMDIFSAIVVVVPLIIKPATQKYGIDPFHLGVIFLLNLEIGYLTPPVGLNLFISGFTFRKPILEVTRATIPFLLCMIVALAIVTYVPALTIVPPPERRGLVTTVLRDVRLAREQASALKEIELPDGKVLKLSDCEKLSEVLDRDTCTALFVEVTRCRSEAGGQAGSPCEKKQIEEYQTLIGDEEEGQEDWNLDDPKSDGDEGADSDGEHGKP